MSHYMLSVTPPTLDCPGDPGSEFITIETQYNLTVTAEQIYSLNISVINSCGDIGEVAEYIIDIGGKKAISKDVLVSIGATIGYSSGVKKVLTVWAEVSPLI